MSCGVLGSLIVNGSLDDFDIIDTSIRWSRFSNIRQETAFFHEFLKHTNTREGRLSARCDNIGRDRDIQLCGACLREGARLLPCL